MVLHASYERKIASIFGLCPGLWRGARVKCAHRGRSEETDQVFALSIIEVIVEYISGILDGTLVRRGLYQLETVIMVLHNTQR